MFRSFKWLRKVVWTMLLKIERYKRNNYNDPYSSFVPLTILICVFDTDNCQEMVVLWVNRVHVVLMSKMTKVKKKLFGKKNLWRYYAFHKTIRFR